jgi:hypothetical protein
MGRGRPGPHHPRELAQRREELDAHAACCAGFLRTEADKRLAVPKLQSACRVGGHQGRLKDAARALRGAAFRDVSACKQTPEQRGQAMTEQIEALRTELRDLMRAYMIQLHVTAQVAGRLEALLDCLERKQALTRNDRIRIVEAGCRVADEQFERVKRTPTREDRDDVTEGI